MVLFVPAVDGLANEDDEGLEECECIRIETEEQNGEENKVNSSPPESQFHAPRRWPTTIKSDENL